MLATHPDAGGFVIGPQSQAGTTLTIIDRDRFTDLTSTPSRRYILEQDDPDTPEDERSAQITFAAPSDQTIDGDAEFQTPVLGERRARRRLHPFSCRPEHPQARDPTHLGRGDQPVRNDHHPPCGHHSRRVGAHHDRGRSHRPWPHLPLSPHPGPDLRDRRRRSVPGTGLGRLPAKPKAADGAPQRTSGHHPPVGATGQDTRHQRVLDRGLRRRRNHLDRPRDQHPGHPLAGQWDAAHLAPHPGSGRRDPKLPCLLAQRSRRKRALPADPRPGTRSDRNGHRHPRLGLHPASVGLVRRSDLQAEHHAPLRLHDRLAPRHDRSVSRAHPTRSARSTSRRKAGRSS